MRVTRTVNDTGQRAVEVEVGDGRIVVGHPRWLAVQATYYDPDGQALTVMGATVADALVGLAARYAEQAQFRASGGDPRR